MVTGYINGGTANCLRERNSSASGDGWLRRPFLIAVNGSDRVDYRVKLNPRSRMDCCPPVFAFFCTFPRKCRPNCRETILPAEIKKAFGCSN
jgi:hypothetical protein